MPHPQIKVTVSSGTGWTKSVLEKLQHINIQGIAAPNEVTRGGELRIVVDHDDVDAAMTALAPFNPTKGPQAFYGLDDQPAQLYAKATWLADKHIPVDSMVVLAGRSKTDKKVVVAVGTGRPLTDAELRDSKALDDSELPRSPRAAATADSR